MRSRPPRASVAPRATTGRPSRTMPAPARSTTSWRASAVSSATTIPWNRSVRRHPESALPEFAAAPLADVAAQLILGLDELGVVVVFAPAPRPAALGELGAIAQLEGAGVEVGEWAALGDLLQEFLA